MWCLIKVKKIWFGFDLNFRDLICDMTKSQILFTWDNE